MVYYNHNKNKEECIGCCLRSICKLDTSYIDPKTNGTIKCPCIDCIVKVMCKGYSSICREYLEYVETVKQREIIYDF